ncbi:DDE_4 domain-containing protein [Gossypium australe]|uniref:DDE_4 domain-containing protein n=1 Tax=Gossypium australe TaxID=47621 RepID=A0A5B6WHJ3_9ROSI|nr:DDE_4 domain-containing protein [Gossypium australe]
MKHGSTRNITQRSPSSIPLGHIIELSLHEMSYDLLECDDEASSSEKVRDDTDETLISRIEPTNEWTMWR